MIGAYFPAILAALTIIPVYFIGKALFNRWIGVLAAALTAILPGEFLGRSILGFTDHHAAETLFSAVTVLFLILAIKEAGQRDLNFGHLIKRDRTVIIRPLVYSLLAGIFLGAYLITWEGGLLFVLIISLYLVIQFIINHLRHKSCDHLGIIGGILFLVAFIIFLLYSPSRSLSFPVITALFIPLVLSGLSWLILSRGARSTYYPLSVIGIGIVFTGIFYAIAPDTLNTLLAKFSIFTPVGATATTTLEMQPIFYPSGTFTTAVAWGNFTTSFLLLPADWGPDNLWFPPGFALIALLILIWLYNKQPGALMAASCEILG